MMGGLLKNLFWRGGIFALVLWYVFFVKFMVGRGFVYEGDFVYVDKIVLGLILLIVGV